MTCARLLALLAALTAGFALVFVIWPNLDLAVAQLFHDQANGFTLAGSPFWEGVLLANKAASLAFVVAVLFALVASILRRGKHSIATVRYSGFVVLLYLFGPGLMVNGALKRSFGRARPAQTLLFGGDGPFTGPWQISDYCHSACSFVSAETAAGTALAVGLVVGGLWFTGRVATFFRALAQASTLLLLLTSVQRIGSGRHFLSDVIFAILPIVALGVVLACLFQTCRTGMNPAKPEGPTE